MAEKERWLQWAIELQSLGQCGIAYANNPYDVEKYQRIREISAEILAYMSDMPLNKVKDIFCCDSGYQTPKMDTRAAIVNDDKILLVRENNGKWAMPGGWCDVYLSISENTIKEVKEEAGLDAVAERIIAIQDYSKRNYVNSAFSICKVFVQCSVTGGKFAENIETTESRYFSLNELPVLAEEKNTAEQIRMCIEASRAEHWECKFD